MTDQVRVERVTDPVDLGEGPHWSSNEGALYYVDIFNQNVHRYHPASSTHSRMHVEGGPVTLVVPCMGRKDSFVVSVGRDLAVVTWNDPTKDCVVTQYTTVASVDPTREGNRFNDGKCDDFGRLWAGTMGKTDVPENLRPDLGNLFLLGHDASISVMLAKVSISNGLAWSADHKTFYFIDTAAYKVEAFDCDFENAKISNRRTLYDYRKEGLYPHFPDGMTIDTDGLLWVASFGTGKIHCINPSTRQVEREVKLPASNLTSVCWGGPNLDQLFVTSTTKNLSKEQLMREPDAGAVFRITGLGARGRPSRDCEVNF
ncbi:regucalcin-like [Penaeus japonicus]|uniref:regucalcin-like n=1 Tax=Penaeus japonicus TaxID=27405 RepID=UPI001C70E0BD|nr:regucalcin-like [Penaeus japonicus]XP_042859957.1 regucalcin-like [Penaeus japonicus]XP_042859958.1 regucalcin-like [Penaeus japonicus]XP_042859959.1 regucalcin-like [Penaeus japonicus]